MFSWRFDLEADGGISVGVNKAEAVKVFQM